MRALGAVCGGYITIASADLIAKPVTQAFLPVRISAKERIVRKSWCHWPKTTTLMQRNHRGAS
jgi:hypothetical protein